MSTIRPVLSISVLASDRMDTIPRCLDSLKPIMERLACELILVDTSGNPKVHELLLQYSKQVEVFTWCDDFSAARNAGLKKATGEWFLFLDDDEWFVEYEDLFRFFESGEYRSYGCANYMVRNFYDRNYEYYAETMVSRMIKLEKETHFESKIHEYLYPVHGACKNLSAKVYHSGYIYETEEERLKHFERNTALLYKMIEEEPQNLRWQTQLAQEYRAVQKWDELEKYCQQCLEKSKANGTIEKPQEALAMLTFYTGYILALSNLEKYEESLRVCEEVLSTKGEIGLGVAMVYLNLAEIFYKKQEYDKAMQSAWQYLKAREQLEQNPAELLNQNTALILNETLEPVKINKIYSIIICADIKKGSLSMLHKYYEKLRWNEDTLYVYEDTDAQILNRLIGNLEQELLLRVLKDGFANDSLRNRMVNVCMEWENKDKQAFTNLMQILAQIEQEDWYVYYAKIWKFGIEKDIPELETALEHFYQLVPNIFIVTESIYEITSACGIEPAVYWKNVAVEKWKGNVQEYLSITNHEHLSKIQIRLKKVFSTEEWRYLFFQLSVIEQEVCAGAKEPWNLSSYVDILQVYVDNILQFYGRYYREEVFLYHRECLPENVQAAICIMEYLELEAEDKIKALGRLKDAVTIYPLFADGLKGFIQQYPQLEMQRAKKQRTQMRNLRNQIVLQVKTLLQQAQTENIEITEKKALLEQAQSIVGQLKQMVSQDLEVITLGLEIRLAMLESLC